VEFSSYLPPLTFSEVNKPIPLCASRMSYAPVMSLLCSALHWNYLSGAD